MLVCLYLGVFSLLGRYAESQNIANDLLRSDGTNADAMFVRGLCLYYEDFVDKAFSHFQQVLRLAPDHQQAKDTYKVKNAFNIIILLKAEFFSSRPSDLQV